MKMTWFATTAVVAAISVLLLAGACATKNDPGKLSGDEVKKLFSGKTLRMLGPGKMRVFELKKNGNLIITDYEGNKHARIWFMQQGAWCITKLENNKGCYYLYDLGNGRYDVRRKRDDASIGLVTISDN